MSSVERGVAEVVEQRRVPQRDHPLARGEPSSVTAATGCPHSCEASPAGSPIVAEVKHEGGIGLRSGGQAAQPAEHVRRVRAEDAPRARGARRRPRTAARAGTRPTARGREDALVDHLGVRQHHVGVGAHPRPLLGRAVAVVGRRRPRPGTSQRAKRLELVVGQRLGREDQERRVADAVGDRLGRSGPGSRATCPTRCRSRPRRATVADEVDRAGLVRPQAADRPAEAAPPRLGAAASRRRRVIRPASTASGHDRRRSRIRSASSSSGRTHGVVRGPAGGVVTAASASGARRRRRSRRAVRAAASRRPGCRRRPWSTTFLMFAGSIVRASWPRWKRSATPTPSSFTWRPTSATSRTVSPALGFLACSVCERRKDEQTLVVRAVEVAVR